MKNPTVYAFIDSQNLHLGIKSLGWKIDYRKFYIYLKEKYKVSNSFIYIGYIKENEHLYRYLKKCGFDLVFKNTKQYGKSRDQVKGNIDVDLTVDVIRKLNQYSDCVFISADGDFCALYDYLIDEKNKRIIIIIPNVHKYSRFLLKYRTNLKFMNDLKGKIGKKLGSVACSTKLQPSLPRDD